jgi:cytochrome c oxidase subunit 2
VRKRLLWAVALMAMVLVLGSCALDDGGQTDLPQNTFDPAGPTAQKQKDLLVPVLWVAGIVFVLVEGGIVLIAIRYRRRKGQERMPPQIHGNTRLEIGWTIAPAVVLAFVMVPTVGLIWELAERPPDAMQITVKGYQWWWGFEYMDEDMQVDYGQGGPIVTADVMVIPTDTTIDLSIESAGGLIGGDDPDHQVAHSFWAPRLFGKQDAMPGRTNHIVFAADEPGTYWGQCAEFCGLQHARMRFRIVALDEARWQSWVENQKQPAVEPTDPLAKQGMDLFLNGVSGGGQCTACHAIGGTEATSPAGPDLTHFAEPTHECFAGCNWETTDVESLKAWLRNPPAVKLGSKMPSYDLTEDEIDALTAYLLSLT